jgi:hypothetical protein
MPVWRGVSPLCYVSFCTFLVGIPYERVLYFDLHWSSLGGFQYCGKFFDRDCKSSRRLFARDVG